MTKRSKRDPYRSAEFESIALDTGISPHAVADDVVEHAGVYGYDDSGARESLAARAEDAYLRKRTFRSKLQRPNGKAFLKEVMDHWFLQWLYKRNRDAARDLEDLRDGPRRRYR